jgi:hypothetical protein
MDAVSPSKNTGSSKLMEKRNCKLAYALYRLHFGDASARRPASAIRSNSIAFVSGIGHWSLLLLWKCGGSKQLVRGYCPAGQDSRFNSRKLGQAIVQATAWYC